MNIQENIFQAIDIITEKKINEIPFDKTVEGMVWVGSKPDEGEYQIKYQDITFTAYSNINTVKYKETTSTSSPNGDVVYVLVPQGDFGNKKTIIGKKEAKGEEFIDVVDMIEKVQMLGDNYVGEEEGFEINFSADGTNKSQNIKIRNSDIVKDFPYKTNLLIGAIVDSDLISEDGDFGIELDVVYDNRINHTYKLSLMDMVGNPYKLQGGYQYKIFTLAMNRLTSVTGARAYFNGFIASSQKEGMGVSFKNIEIQYVKPKDAEGLENFSARLKAPQGTSFKNGLVNPNATLKLTMSLSKLGKEFSPNAVYKWYVMDSTVDDMYVDGWDIDGGLGWRLINFNDEIYKDKLTLDENGKTIIVHADFVPNFEVFKCFAVFGGEKIEEQEYGAIKLEAIETIVDQTDGLNIVVMSSNGDAFKKDDDITSTELVCKVYLGAEIVEPTKFVYTWIKIKDDGTQEIIGEKFQESEKLTVLVKDDIINIRNYICEVFLKE